MRTYCIKHCMPISHSADGSRGHAHGRTIEAAMYLSKADNQFQRFSDMERKLHDYLNTYAGPFLNDFSIFSGDTSIENIGEVFFSELFALAAEDGQTLTRLEIGETPLRCYVIGLTEES